MKKPPNSCTALLALLLPVTASGGIIEITGMQARSKAVIKTYGENGAILATIEIKDSDGSGKTAVQLSHQDRVRRITIYKLDTNGKQQIEDGKFKTASLFNAEPFQMPSFLPADSATAVLVSFDFDPFLAQADPFVLGQTVVVNAGVVSATSAVTFKDPTSLAGFPPDEPFDVTLLDSLPDFTGSVVVGPATTFNLVPEPAAWASSLVCLGMFGAFLAFRSRRATRFEA